MLPFKVGILNCGDIMFYIIGLNDDPFNIIRVTAKSNKSRDSNNIFNKR